LENSRKYFDPQTLAKLSGLSLRARRIVEGLVAGSHRSPFRGFSIEFAEHREYTPGDDVRYIDWKLFGRSDKFYLKQYEDETNLLAYILVDTSESMLYQGPSASMSKLDYARCIAATIAYLVMQQQDSAGLVTFDSETCDYLPPTSAASAWNQIIHILENCRTDRKSHTGPIFHELAERLRRRGVVLILSDLLDDVDAMLAGLKHFRHRQHDVIVFHLLDPAEIDFPFDRPTLFRGMEGFANVTADPVVLRRAYRRQFEQYSRQLKAGLLERQMDYQLVRTDQSMDRVLSKYLAARMAGVG